MKTKNNLLPLIIGVTGHIDILEEDREVLKSKLSEFFLIIKKEYPHTPIKVLSSLAEGADQLFAEFALTQKLELVAVLPMPSSDYILDFQNPNLFESLLKSANRVIIAPAFEQIPAVPARSFFYRQAGFYLANSCHLLLALWNGEEKLSLEAGGTYETICFALKPLDKNPVYINEIPKVFQIVTPRCSSSKDNVNNFEIQEYSGASNFSLPKFDIFSLKLLDEYNNDVSIQPISLSVKTIHTYQDYYNIFDELTLYYQKKKLHVLRFFALTGLLLVCSFLLYDEMQSNLMLIVYGILLIFAGLVNRLNVKNKYHEKYIRYRALSENFRIQNVFSVAGLPKNCYDCYNFAASYELGFVKTFVLSCKDLSSPFPHKKSKTNISIWIDEQKSYHKYAYKNNLAIERSNEIVSKVLLVSSVAVFLLVFIMEFFFKSSIENGFELGKFGYFLMLHSTQPLSSRSIIKILLATISAATAFVTNYYGNLETTRKLQSNKRMLALFSRIKSAPNGKKIDDDIIFILGRECILENANWYISELKNAPTVIVG